jgi:short-subunit dehydrogenase
MKSVAFITGASGGIGAEFARIFARDHHDLVLTARSVERLEEVAAEVRANHGVEVVLLPADLASPSAPKELLEETARRGIRVDYLVNNAGFGNYGEFSEHDLATELEQIQVNVTALTALTHGFLSGMLERRNGRILNVASTAGFQPCPLQAVYGATKAYVLTFSEALVVELRGSGVSVTCLCPGPTGETNFSIRSGYAFESALEGLSRLVPDAHAVAEYGYRALFAGESVAVHGLANRMLTASSRFVPRRLVATISGRMLSKGQRKAAEPSE